ncbi:Neuropeptide-Like Protein [Caenorhabditis elegans]|uniref:Neuropeptide-Like Protein n=1 Tax=Caenorhabditis elegans TaxID=6239 RepID=Q7YWW1_CAEEL|nr:Neuropeptide-Like Protein [Caenorhabditis elegans]CAE17909.1 Neuropeptide-Like Protein [Caenorhabditis elegans]|eukprot:NP_001024845.1 Neuropeptide-Like Protein [Caenorhabditis elegans]
MSSGKLFQFFIVFLATLLLADAIPMVSSRDEDDQIIQKRLSNDALIRLLMRNRGTQTQLGLKRGLVKKAEVERRSIDEDFSNCFLSPVQCMLPSSRK